MPHNRAGVLVDDELRGYVLADPAVVRRTLNPGATMSLGTSNDALAIVVEGTLALQLRRNVADIVTIEILGVGGYVPLTGQARLVRQPLVLSALTRSTVARVPTAGLERVLRRHPSLSPMVGRALTNARRELLERVSTLAERSPTLRLAATLAYLASKVGQKCSLANGTRVPMTQHVIAQAADLSRQTVNRYLRQLQAIGVLRIERGLVCVLDLAGVEAIANGAPASPVWRPAGGCKYTHPRDPLTCFPLIRAKARRPE